MSVSEDIVAKEAIDSVSSETSLRIGHNTSLINRCRHRIRISYLAITAVIVVIATIAVTRKLFFPTDVFFPPFGGYNPATQSEYNPTFTIFFIFISFTGTLVTLFSVYYIIWYQTTITTARAEIESLREGERVSRQLSSIDSESSLAHTFDKLVQINVKNLAEYYALVKSHASRSFTASLMVAFTGFFFIMLSLAIGFTNVTNSATISYISAGAGVITEFIAGIFFYLYNRTVLQMKEYHDGLLAVQNILLSFKIVGDTHSEDAKTKLLGQILEYLIGRQTSTADTDHNNPSKGSK